MARKREITNNNEILIMESESNTENAVVELIRKRGKVGRGKYKKSMDRRDLHPDEWVQHLQEELADALQYAERIKGATKLLHEAREIMMFMMQERGWDCAILWVDNYNKHFLPKRNE